MNKNINGDFQICISVPLIDNCSIKLPNLQQNGRHNGHAFILAPYHVCHVFLKKLHGLKFHGPKIIIEEAKTPPRTLVN